MRSVTCRGPLERLKRNGFCHLLTIFVTFSTSHHNKFNTNSSNTKYEILKTYKRNITSCPLCSALFIHSFSDFRFVIIIMISRRQVNYIVFVYSTVLPHALRIGWAAAHCSVIVACIRTVGIGIVQQQRHRERKRWPTVWQPKRQPHRRLSLHFRVELWGIFWTRKRIMLPSDDRAGRCALECSL